ncbi:MULTISPECIES: hypothetical protein [unclassified Bradyrhizobium]|uniref:hypothetical protein n=1 Tax=unclassified Bradyrhizobium TaxID=2631580 RepID=UPI002478A1A3|nr:MULTISPECIES: hypothetical protein [unclassified Bradyrhizobium]WGS19028.1 hypothetical protein MTX22_31705 [Bradyrhizobium sp. ISRA463]WGS25862.1 hypothetical protein MTX19_29265 [Bradyrhizobium sp. ISRA464]
MTLSACPDRSVDEALVVRREFISPLVSGCVGLAIFANRRQCRPHGCDARKDLFGMSDQGIVIERINRLTPRAEIISQFAKSNRITQARLFFQSPVLGLGLDRGLDQAPVLVRQMRIPVQRRRSRCDGSAIGSARPVQVLLKVLLPGLLSFQHGVVHIPPPRVEWIEIVRVHSHLVRSQHD